MGNKSKYIIGYDDGDGISCCGLAIMKRKSGVFVYTTNRRWKAKLIIRLALLFNQSVAIEK